MNFSAITHGQPLVQMRTPGFAITEANYPPAYDIPPHHHEAASLTFVLKGGLAEAVQGRTHTLARRELLLKPAATAHSNRIGESGARLLLVELIDPALMSRGIERAFQRPFRINAPAAAVPLVRVADELERRDTFSSLCIEGLLLQLIGELARMDTRDARGVGEPAYLRRTRERLHAGVTQRLRIGYLAAAENMDAARLSRSFRRHYGCGMGDYLRRLRLDRAMEALARTNDSICAIALRCGFADQSHLTRELHRAIGMTPRRYREGLR